MPGERAIVTAEELLRMPDDGTRHELVRGVLRQRAPASAREGMVATRVMAAIHRHAETRRLGLVLPAGTCFLLDRNPDTVLAPDAAFATAARLPAELPVGCFPGPPDLVAEVVPPSEDPAAEAARAQVWLHAGCGAVWVVEPEGRTVAVYDSEDRGELLAENEVLDGGAVLRGFAMPVRELFS